MDSSAVNLKNTVASTSGGPPQRRIISEIEQNTIKRTIWHIIPFLMFCYFISYLDRVNLSFAALQMNAALGLTQTAYGLGASLFFLTYFICEIPSNLLLYRYGASRWIARIMFTLGLCAAGMAFVQGETGFYVMRLLLGAAEAGFYPGVLYFLTLWFPAAYRGRILGIFIAAIPVSGIIGAPLSSHLLNLDGVAGLQGWQWLFLVEAVPALIIAPFVVLVLQDSPAQAKWLPKSEKDWLIGKLASERSTIEKQRHYSIVQCLVNPRVLFLALIYFSNVCMLNSITFFMPQIVKGFGLSIDQTGWVMMTPSLLALVALILWGRSSDRRKERYGHAALANFVGGAALLASVLVDDPVFRIAALAIAFACTLAFTSPFWAIPGSFLTGGAAAGGIGVISALGVTGGFLSPYFNGYIKDHYGNYTPAFGCIAVLAMVLGASLYLFGRRVASSNVPE